MVMAIRSRRGRVSRTRWYLADCEAKEGSLSETEGVAEDTPLYVHLVRVPSFFLLISRQVTKRACRRPTSDTTTPIEETRRSSKGLLLPLPSLLFPFQSVIIHIVQRDAPFMTFFVVTVIATSNTEEKAKGRALFCLVKLESGL